MLGSPVGSAIAVFIPIRFPLLSSNTPPLYTAVQARANDREYETDKGLLGGAINVS